MDPYERAAIASDQYDAWQFKNAFIIGQVVFHSVAFLETFIKYPPSQLSATFSPNEIEAEIDRINGAKLKPHSVTRE